MQFELNRQEADDLLDILKTSQETKAARLRDRLTRTVNATTYRACDWCQSEFEVQKPDQRFCCPNCRINAHRRDKRTTNA